MQYYAVIGNPIAHSLSPVIHQQFAKLCGIKLDYQLREAPIGAFVESVNAFKKNGGNGLNVTQPFKVEAFHYVDELSNAAKLAGAVNTILFHKDGSSFGDNTDGRGLVRDLTHNHQINLNKKNILLIGAGGAARGVMAPLLKEKPNKLIISNRSMDKADALAKQFKQFGHIQSCASDAMSDDFDLIINATNFSLNLPLQHGMLYNMAYTLPAHSTLETLDGYGMLVEQAAESFFLWHGVRPETTFILAKHHTLSKLPPYEPTT